ncbi:MAG: restriction endonuclease subunit S, partial [Opitutales bacterium]|nr:restriction endonuclease subunit S [Opitutales bacterium]
GATVDRIPLKEFPTFKILVPPIPTQQAIVEKLDALSEETKALEAIYERKQSALAELKQSLLQKAFAGEL